MSDQPPPASAEQPLTAEQSERAFDLVAVNDDVDLAKMYVLLEAELQAAQEREKGLRDLLYEDWKARVEANDEAAGTAPTPTARWYFDELLERRLAAQRTEEAGG